MDFKKEGWFRRYIRFREENPFTPMLPTFGVRVLEEEGVHNESDQAIYYFLQPTGLLYGSPVAYPFPAQEYPRSRYFDESDRGLVTLLDALFACLVGERTYLLSGLVDDDRPFERAIEVAGQYYHTYPSVFASRPEWWTWRPSLSWRRAEPHARFEREFRGRFHPEAHLFAPRRRLDNVFLFLDLYHCLLWQRRLLMDGAAYPAGLMSLYAEQIDQREALLKLLIAAVFADERVDRRERRLMRRLLRTSRLPAGRRQALLRYMETGLSLEEVDLPPMPWLIRRYFLALTLTIVLLDRNISESEDVLLHRVVDKLGLWPGELEQSRAALEGFLVANGDLLEAEGGFLDVVRMSQQLRDRATIAVRMNLDRIVAEIRETQELYGLLTKAARVPLTREEKRKVREQLMDILKTIPAVAIFALPGGGFILPVIIRLLPFNLLPSSFED